jgi:hypothetical protein
MNKITSNTVLGILGSGQLARMTCLAANTFGIQTHVYCTEKDLSPAEHVATKTFKGNFFDLEAILNFCQSCDVVTLENEFIDQHILESIDEKFPGMKEQYQQQFGEQYECNSPQSKQLYETFYELIYKYGMTPKMKFYEPEPDTQLSLF